jgi:hypothetical protein
MFKAFFSILVFFLFPLQGFSLRESLEKAHTGDFIVYEASRLYTFIRVRAKKDHFIVFDEIVISTDCLKSLQKSFPEWFKEGALNHASWMIYEVDLKKAQILKSYSRTKQTSEEAKDGCFLSKLLQLSCEAKEGSWSPPLPPNFEGPSKQWAGLWPHDGSLLSEASVTCFTASLPFPYWIEIKKDKKRFLMRAVANGQVVNKPTKS